MIDDLLAATEVGVGRIERGRVVEAEEDSLLVTLDGSTEPIRCQLLHTSRAGGDVLLAVRDTVLVFHTGRADDWGVVLGRVGHTHAAAEPTMEDETPEELVIEATKNLTLKCGDGSITLREDGRILIKGKDLVSHAQRMNRIRGGSVSIN